MLKDLLKNILVGFIIGICFTLITTYIKTYLNGDEVVKNFESNYIKSMQRKNSNNLVNQKLYNICLNEYNQVLKIYDKELKKEGYDIDLLKIHPKLLVVKRINKKNFFPFQGHFANKDYEYNSFINFLMKETGILNKVYKNINGVIVIQIPDINPKFLSEKQKKEMKKIIFNMLIHETSHFIFYKIAKLKGYNTRLFLSEYTSILMQYRFGKKINYKNNSYLKFIDPDKGYYIDFNYSRIKKEYPLLTKKEFEKAVNRYNNFLKKEYYETTYFMVDKNRIKEPMNPNPEEYYNAYLARKDLLSSKKNIEYFYKYPIKYTIISLLKRKRKIIAHLNELTAEIFFKIKKYFHLRPSKKLCKSFI